MLQKLLPPLIALISPLLLHAETDTIGKNWEPAICFSAYRDGQSPVTQTYPSIDEISSDLHLIEPHFKLLRLYDCSEYAARTLEAIRREKLPIKILLGASLDAEFANPNNAWTDWSTVDFDKNKKHNEDEIERLIHLANKYPNIITAVAVGNEALVDWTDHPVKPKRSLQFVLKVKSRIKQPVTVCENWVPWQDGLKKLADAVDFISMHTYPQWEGKTIDQALDYSKANYYSVCAAHPGKKVIITEAGWCTTSNNQQMIISSANEENQSKYLKELLNWARNDQITIFLFEAFDENWKGSDAPNEPEKHWGIYNANRTPKQAIELLN